MDDGGGEVTGSDRNEHAVFTTGQDLSSGLYMDMCDNHHNSSVSCVLLSPHFTDETQTDSVTGPRLHS